MKIHAKLFDLGCSQTNKQPNGQTEKRKQKYILLLSVEVMILLTIGEHIQVLFRKTYICITYIG